MPTRREAFRFWLKLGFISFGGPAGMIVPIFNLAGQIVALTVRRENDDDGPRYCYISSARHGGPGPGAPVHVPNPRPRSDSTCRLTEGALKAAIADGISEMFTISVPGVGHWRAAIPVLRAAEITKVAR